MSALRGRVFDMMFSRFKGRAADAPTASEYVRAEYSCYYLLESIEIKSFALYVSNMNELKILKYMKHF